MPRLPRHFLASEIPDWAEEIKRWSLNNTTQKDLQAEYSAFAPKIGLLFSIQVTSVSP
jgi:hypothetical protein